MLWMGMAVINNLFVFQLLNLIGKLKCEKEIWCDMNSPWYNVYIHL